MSRATISWTKSSTVSNAEFQAANVHLTDVLEAGGVIRTSDTGQYNPATENFPGTNNNYTPYEIRRFSDALQATHPVFIKIEVGRGGATGIYGWRLTFGTGSDGSGNITGIFKTQAVAFNTSSLAHTQPLRASAGPNWFAFVGSATTASNSFGLAVERTINPATKDPTESGIMYWQKSSGAGSGSSGIRPFTGSPPAESAQGGCVPNPGETSTVGGSGVNVYPWIMHGLNGRLESALTTIAGVFTADIGAAEDVESVEMFGVNQDMIILPADTIRAARGNTPDHTTLLGMMRYEA